MKFLQIFELEDGEFQPKARVYEDGRFEGEQYLREEIESSQIVRKHRDHLLDILEQKYNSMFYRALYSDDTKNQT